MSTFNIVRTTANYQSREGELVKVRVSAYTDEWKHAGSESLDYQKKYSKLQKTPQNHSKQRIIGPRGSETPELRDC